MIISKITGGLGNQMFQYAIGRAISIQQKTKLQLDISSYKKSKQHQGYRLDAFNIGAVTASALTIRIFKTISQISSKVIRYKEKEKTIFDSNIFQYKNLYLQGYWQNENYFVHIRDILIEDFTLKRSLSSASNEYLSNINNSESVSLHVRRGDYLLHSNLGILSLEYYKSGLSYIQEKLNKDIEIFIFSDDIPWCMQNFNFIEKKTFIEKSENELEDMLLMKKCKHNIIANSTFSWWAAWLNENKEKIIVSPKLWIQDNPKDYNWAAHSWIKM